MGKKKRANHRVRAWILGVLTCGELFLCFPPTAAAQDLRAGVEQLATRIIEATSEANHLRIAVADFPDLENVTSDLGRYIANRLTTRLAQSPKFSVVERQRLGQILAELKFGMSDLVDPTKAKQLGQIAGVEALVVGTVSDLGNQVDIDIRLIEINTSHMLLGATTTISKDQVVTQLLERGRETGTLSSPAASAGSSSSQPSLQPARATGPVKAQEFPKFRVEIERLQVGSNGVVTLFLAYTNKTREEQMLGICALQDKTFLIDAAGERSFNVQGSGIGEVCNASVPQEPLTLGSGMRTVVSLKFLGRFAKEGSLFSFMSAQSIVTTGASGKRLWSPYNVYISDIEAR
jgi:TolB-like protein